jgi:hypothetical protein
MAFSTASFLLRLVGEMAGTAENFDLLLVVGGTDEETWRRAVASSSFASLISSSFASLISSLFASLISPSFASFISSEIAGFEDVLLLDVMLFVSATSVFGFLRVTVDYYCTPRSTDTASGINDKNRQLPE